MDVMKSYRYSPTLFFLILIVMFSTSAGSEERFAKALENAGSGPIVITSDTLELDNSRNMVTFSGKVEAKRADFTITCQKMIVRYNDQKPGKAGGKVEMKINEIIATGQVKITRPDGGVAMAEKAIYYEKDQKVILTGNPVVKQGKDFVEGSRITLFLREKRSLVEGSAGHRVKAVLNPKSK